MRAMVAWLSTNTVMGVSTSTNASSNCFRYMRSLHPSDRAIISASVDESDTHFCLELEHSAGLLFMKTTQP